MATNNYNQVAIGTPVTTQASNNFQGNPNQTAPEPKISQITRCGKTLIKIDLGMKRGTPIR
tara:strand:+ start:534 stop:716 length:183 start_codon:yes stop_codon:yes gene_type:complete